MPTRRVARHKPEGGGRLDRPPSSQSPRHSVTDSQCQLVLSGRGPSQ
jgi:hypothetical protein